MSSIDEDDKKILLWLIIGSFVVVYIISFFISFQPAPKNVDTSFLENAKYETCMDIIPCTTFVVDREQTLEQIAENFATSPDTIISANPDIIPDTTRLISKGVQLKIPDRAGVYYVIVEGDTLQSILEKHGIEFNSERSSEFLRINGIKEENIKAGIRIFLPGGKLAQGV